MNADAFAERQTNARWIIDDDMHEGKSFNIKIIWKRKKDNSVPYRLAARQTRL